MYTNIQVNVIIDLIRSKGYYLFAWRRLIPISGIAITEVGTCH